MDGFSQEEKKQMIRRQQIDTTRLQMARIAAAQVVARNPKPLRITDHHINKSQGNQMNSGDEQTGGSRP